MNSSIRRTAAGLLVGFFLLVLNLTYLQAIAGPRYRDDLRNRRVQVARAETERGPILSREGVVLAQSRTQTDGSFRRVYPEGSLYAHTVGFSSLLFGDRGLERTRQQQLVASPSGTISAIIDSLLGRTRAALGLRLTLSHTLQAAAATAMGSQTGAVVALDANTGEVLAYYSSPVFDPTLLLGETPGPGDALEADLAQPLLDRAGYVTYAPGSAFKIITAAAGLEAGSINSASEFPNPAQLALPGSTATISNFGGGRCGTADTATVSNAFRLSCNTVFAQVAMELGAEELVTRAEAAGFNQSIPFELAVLDSVIPSADSFANDLPGLAQTGIGHRDLRTTPLQMALVAAAVATDGSIMSPYLVDEVFTASLEAVERTEPRIWKRAMSPGTAAALRELMLEAVTNGTGTRAQVDGLSVGGKTGTAEVPGGSPHAWFVGFATSGNESLALAVLVESGGALGEEATGGSVAAPIAGAIISTWSQITPLHLSSPE